MRKRIYVIVILIVVLMAGFYLWRSNNDQVVETDDWATYVSPELGFQVEYPDDWRHEDCLTDGFGIVAFGEGEEQLLICNSDAPPLSYVNVAVVGLASDFDSLVQNMTQGLKDVERSDILVAGQNAVKIFGKTPDSEGPGLPEGIEETNILLTHNNKIYLLMHFNLENKDYLDKFYKMVESFQFIDSASPTPSS